MQTIKYKSKKFKTLIINDNEHLQKFWKAGVFYELNMLNYIRENYKNELDYLDIGMCIGNHSLFFGGVMGANCVTSFEPIFDLHEHANKVVELNGLTDIIKTHNVALSNRKGLSKMQLSDLTSNAGMSKIDENGDTKVYSIRLDSMQFDNIDVMKIDVEAHNMKMLSGAKKTIQKHKPDIFIESTDDFKEVSNFLADLGYKFTGKTFNRTPTHLFVCE